MSLKRARRAYRKLQGKPADRVIRANVPVPPPTAFLLGEIVEIGYKRPGEKIPYYHKFKRTRPLLVSDPRGKRLFFAGGTYKITPRGIVG